MCVNKINFMNHVFGQFGLSGNRAMLVIGSSGNFGYRVIGQFALSGFRAVWIIGSSGNFGYRVIRQFGLSGDRRAALDGLTKRQCVQRIDKEATH